MEDEARQNLLGLPSWLTIQRDAKIWFWINTLCISRGENKESLMLRAKAIRKIDLVFSGAEFVIVLDEKCTRRALIPVASSSRQI